MIVGVVLLLVLGITWEIYRSQYGLETTYYEIPLPDGASGSQGFRVVQLTDLHSSIFGEDNCELVDAVADACPDLILITGDMVNDKRGGDTSIAEALIGRLREIAPVYVSYGNQENSLESNGGMNIQQIYGSAGAIVLDDAYVDIEVKGYAVRLGGFYGYGHSVMYAEESSWRSEIDYMMAFQDTDRYKILMCHMPLLWLEEDSLSDYQVDCVLAGHAHGGQIRLPLIGGLWAPDQGWFPGRMCGVYETSEEHWKEHRDEMRKWAMEKTESAFDYASYYNSCYFDAYSPSYLVLSRGLGNTDWIPRFHNVPEVVVIDYR